VPLSPSSIIWYLPRGGDFAQLGRSDIVLAMGPTLSGLSTYGLNGHREGDEHPIYSPYGAWHSLPFVAKVICRIHFVS